jgi:hypothetical protein
MCVFLCFDEVRNTEAWKHNPLVPSVLYFASPNRISSHMMGDIVPGRKLPLPMYREFSWVTEQQRP